MHDLIHDTAPAAVFSDDKMKKVNLYESPLLFCDVYCLKPGQSQKPHTHPANDKVYYALTGTCHIILGDDAEPLGSRRDPVSRHGPQSEHNLSH